jgi:flagellar biogenesis protein FliO
MDWMDYGLFAGFVLLIIFLVYVVCRMGRNYFKGKDDLW